MAYNAKSKGQLQLGEKFYAPNVGWFLFYRKQQIVVTFLFQECMKSHHRKLSLENINLKGQEKAI